MKIKIKGRQISEINSRVSNHYTHAQKRSMEAEGYRLCLECEEMVLPKINEVDNTKRCPECYSKNCFWPEDEC